MKTITTAFAFGLISLVLACGKKDNDDITPATTGVVTAQVDGQAFTSEQATSTYTKTSKELTLVGYNGTHMMGFTLTNFANAGAINLVEISKTGSTGSYVDVKTNVNYTIKEGRSGTVNVTKFDGTTIEGTFSMKTYNTQQKREVVITNGTFKVPVENL